MSLWDAAGWDGGRWRSQAACRGRPTDWWVPDSGPPDPRAVEICSGCPVAVPCGAVAEAGREVGLWGGVFVPVAPAERPSGMVYPPDRDGERLCGYCGRWQPVGRFIWRQGHRARHRDCNRCRSRRRRSRARRQPP
jgi:hypothetical protein